MSDSFCMECGARVENPAYRFCTNCGAPVNREASEPDPSEEVSVDAGAGVEEEQQPTVEKAPEVELDADQEEMLKALYAEALKSAKANPEVTTAAEAAAAQFAEAAEAVAVEEAAVPAEPAEAEPIEAVPKPKLLRISTGEEFVFWPPVEIGRGSMAAVRILNNNAISRRHARIEESGRHYWLTDLGSANKTFVGGKQLEPNVPAEIEDGALVRIANEDFIFMVG